MRRVLGGLAAVAVLAGCSPSPPTAESAPTSSAGLSPAAPSSVARTTLPPERQEQVFSASMGTLGIVPAVGSIDEMRIAAGNLCVGYGQGATYPEQLNTLVGLGMSLDQATAFEETTLTVYCPEYLPS